MRAHEKGRVLQKKQKDAPIKIELFGVNPPGCTRPLAERHALGELDAVEVELVVLIVIRRCDDGRLL